MDEQNRTNDLEGAGGARKMELTVRNESTQVLLFQEVKFEHGRWKDNYTPPETIANNGKETFLVTSKTGASIGVSGNIYLVANDTKDPLTIYFNKPFGTGKPECTVTSNTNAFACKVTLVNHGHSTDKYDIDIHKKG